MKIKIDPLDTLFSKYIRLRAKGYCEYCGTYKGFKYLQCSHFHGRRSKATRWHEDNCAALCFACHQKLGEDPLLHTEWFKKRLGEKFEALKIQARTIYKPDLKAIELYLKKRLEELDGM